MVIMDKLGRLKGLGLWLHRWRSRNDSDRMLWLDAELQVMLTELHYPPIPSSVLGRPGDAIWATRQAQTASIAKRGPATMEVLSELPDASSTREGICPSDTLVRSRECFSVMLNTALISFRESA